MRVKARRGVMRRRELMMGKAHRRVTMMDNARRSEGEQKVQFSRL